MNEVISIKPTDAGWRQIVGDVDRKNDRLRQDPRCIVRISVPKVDADGYISGQFWALMKYFDWEECDPGGDMPFSDLRILLPPEKQWTVEEIRRLRAKTNRLIRVHNEQDANGNHIGEHYAATEDLILEDEI